MRINRYAPLDDWRRLRANKTVGWGYRYTLGALSVVGEAILPGRLLGGDHYNPFTGTIHLYSDIPAVALHEGGHAKDFTRRDFPGTYALLTGLPVVSLWPEAIATGDAIAYADRQDDPDLQREAYRILYPAYGTYVGGAVGDLAAPVALPVYAGAVVAGHAVGRTMTLTFAKDNLERSIQMVAEETGIPMEILGGDLQLEGITKNQSFGLDERDKTAAEILRVILAKSTPEGKLVYLVQEKDGEEWVLITTRAAAKKRGDTLPAAFTTSGTGLQPVAP